MRSFFAGVLVAPALGLATPAAPAAGGGGGPEPLLRAALVRLARQPAFRTVRDAPSLREVSLVEPRAHAEAATLSFTGPKGFGTLQVVVAGGSEELRGDTGGWEDFLVQSGAPAALVALAPSLAGTWYSTPAHVSYGPSLGGIGHVFCTGRGCSLSGARLVAQGRTTLVQVPGFGGRLMLGRGDLPVELEGTGSRAGLLLRFSYLPRAAPLRPPAGAVPLPAPLGG